MSTDGPPLATTKWVATTVVAINGAAMGCAVATGGLPWVFNTGVINFRQELRFGMSSICTRIHIFLNFLRANCSKLQVHKNEKRLQNVLEKLTKECTYSGFERLRFWIEIAHREWTDLKITSITWNQHIFECSTP